MSESADSSTVTSEGGILESIVAVGLSSALSAMGGMERDESPGRGSEEVINVAVPIDR